LEAGISWGAVLMSLLVCLLEERSAALFLETILPDVLPSGTTFRCIPFEGKTDLEGQLVRKLRNWKTQDTRFLVLRDQDASDCRQVKDKLRRLCVEAGKEGALVRIACHELESFYFGDLVAVDKALGTNLARMRNRSRYRVPDDILKPSEELARISEGRYQKIAGTRAIAPLLDHSVNSVNTSYSFKKLISGITNLFKDELR
jgi:hypothetical protein